MTHVFRSSLAACVALPLVLLLGVPAAQAQQPAEEPITVGTPLTDRLVEAAQSGEHTPDAIAEELSLPSEGAGSLTFDEAGQVTATVMFAEVPDEAILSRVAEISDIERHLAPFPAATVRVLPEDIATLVSVPGVLSVTPTLQPFTGSDVTASRAQSRIAPTTSAADADTGCRSLPVEADGPLRSAEAREAFGVDGSGVTVGIISDSFGSVTMPTSWADDVTLGALPGPGNPCGYTTPVEIVSDVVGGDDEGRAMAQLVHGIAPGARILFADAGRNEIEMAMNIEALTLAGADIIVDDITWPQETYFQKSFISSAIDTAKSEHGVAYFTSAGNSNASALRGPAAGAPIASWQTTAYRPTACPAWVEHDPGHDCLDFNPDPAVDTPYDTLSIRDLSGESADLRPLASLGEPVFGVTTSYELRFYEVDGETPRLLTSISSFGFPYPGLFGSVPVDENTDVRMVLVRTAHDASASERPAVYIGFIRGADAIAERHFTQTVSEDDRVLDRVGATVFGHGGDGSGVGTASLDWEDPTAVREYSSLGPNTLIYDTVRTEAIPAAALPAPVTVASPQIAAVDGTRTTFFGGEPDYRFFGTSAAAPHAAAVAALGASYAPGIRGDALTAALRTTARGTADGGPISPFPSLPDTHVFGSGIVDAVALLEELPAPAPAPSAMTATANGPHAITAQWATTGDPTSYTIELRDGTDGDGPIIQTARLDGTATSHRFGELQPNHQYSIRLTALGAGGAGGSTIAAATTTPRAPQGLTVREATTTELRIVWDADTAVDHYRVSVHGSDTGVRLSAGTTAHTLRGLSPDQRYTVTLEAVGVVGDVSATTVTGRTRAVPAPPADDPAPTTTPGAPHASGSLPATGAEQAPWPLIGAGALAVLLGITALAGAWIRRRADSR